MAGPGGRAVALPVYNEAANLADLLAFLLADDALDTVIAVDDCSTDASPEILSAFASRDERLKHVTSKGRSGQLAAWRVAAENAPPGSSLCFIDADSMPARGAVELLFDCIEADPTIAIASGRVMPDDVSKRWAAARFRASALHRLRLLGRTRDSIIGRFFATRREWFLDTATRSDIVANDAYLAASAARENLTCRYVPAALCYYAESLNTFDFAAQRQRADAGYRQLRDMGVLLPQDEPSSVDYAGVFAGAGIGDPYGALSWAGEQLRARRVKAYRPAGKDAGGWDIQPSTKRKIDSLDGRSRRS